MTPAKPHTAEDPRVLAAPAPLPQDDGDETPAEAAELAQEVNLHDLCERWSGWCRSRRIYVRASLPPSILGRLTRKTSAGGTPGGPDAACSAELAAFHLAYLGQPAEALDRRVFELHYYWRVRNVKTAAAHLGISRQHWYRLVIGFRERTHRQSLDILAINQAAYQALPSVAQKKAGA